MFGQLAEVGARLLKLPEWGWNIDEGSNYLIGMEEASRYLQNNKVRLQINRKIKERLRNQKLNEAKYYRGYDRDNFRVGKKVKSNDIRRGMKLAIGQGRGDYLPLYVEVLGFTGNDQKYGEGGVKYNSVQEIFRVTRGVSNLKQLEQHDSKNEYGYAHYMIARDIDPTSTIKGEEGAWYHIHKGRWSRGSGSEPLSFRELNFTPKREKPPVQSKRPYTSRGSVRSSKMSRRYNPSRDSSRRNTRRGR